MLASVQNEPSNLKYLMWQKNYEFFPVFIRSHIWDLRCSAKPVQCYIICKHLDLLLLSALKYVSLWLKLCCIIDMVNFVHIISFRLVMV